MGIGAKNDVPFE